MTGNVHNGAGDGGGECGGEGDEDNDGDHGGAKERKEARDEADMAERVTPSLWATGGEGGVLLAISRGLLGGLLGPRNSTRVQLCFDIYSTLYSL